MNSSNGFKWRVYGGPVIDFDAIEDQQMPLAQLQHPRLPPSADPANLAPQREYPPAAVAATAQQMQFFFDSRTKCI